MKNSHRMAGRPLRTFRLLARHAGVSSSSVHLREFGVEATCVPGHAGASTACDDKLRIKPIKRKRSFVADPDIDAALEANRPARLLAVRPPTIFTVLPLPIDRGVIMRLLDSALADPGSVTHEEIKKLTEQRKVVYSELTRGTHSH